mmetsp:Transcript_12261/g.27044  ORF Transcript_12261/g.27044 Transcript_12261/m.27044 type:complete len:128 (+) Transcript_12261:66-449(+)
MSVQFDGCVPVLCRIRCNLRWIVSIQSNDPHKKDLASFDIVNQLSTKHHQSSPWIPKLKTPTWLTLAAPKIRPPARYECALLRQHDGVTDPTVIPLVGIYFFEALSFRLFSLVFPSLIHICPFSAFP